MLPSCGRCPSIENVPGRLTLVFLPFSRAAGVTIGNRILSARSFQVESSSSWLPGDYTYSRVLVFCVGTTHLVLFLGLISILRWASFAPGPWYSGTAKEFKYCPKVI